MTTIERLKQELDSKLALLNVNEDKEYSDSEVEFFEAQAKLSQHQEDVEEFKKKIEKLRKDTQWFFQRHVKGEYTIFQIKRHINDLFTKELKSSLEKDDDYSQERLE